MKPLIKLKLDRTKVTDKRHYSDEEEVIDGDFVTLQHLIDWNKVGVKYEVIKVYI